MRLWTGRHYGAALLTMLTIGKAQGSSSQNEREVYGKCQATGENSLIDNMQDGDHFIGAAEGRLGTWYTFNPGASCQQEPKVDSYQAFTMTPDKEKGYVAASSGKSCTANGWSGGGIGVEFLSVYKGLDIDPELCHNGYDASVYRGLSFALRAEQNLRLQVCTRYVLDYNCHGYDIVARGDGWREVSIPWSQMLQEDWGPATTLVPFNPANIVSIQFKTSVENFSFAIADLKFISEQVGGDEGGKGIWHAYRPKNIFKGQLATEYDNWKARHLVQCSDGSADVQMFPGESVSEATAYGLLIAVSMDDKETFDQLLRGFEKRKNFRGMMSWKFAVCGDVWQPGAATDADLDIAMALIMADRKWGQYRQAAESVITALKQYGTSQCKGMLILRPGDNWGGCQDPSDKRLNPSYFAPAYYQAFGRFLPNQADFWNQLVIDTYRLLDQYQQSNDGLLPDWSYADGSLAGPYGYEACRVPWRMATDYAWNSRAEAKKVLNGIRGFVASNSGPARATEHKNSCFIGGFALTATAESQDLTDRWYEEWLSSIPQSPDNMVGDNPYYQGSLRVLYLLLASGQFKL
ncbi:MAG: glycosyl hydrolase family 8 [Oligoflexus sp.]